MTTKFTEAEKGTLPGYSSAAEAEKLTNIPFGMDRPLSVAEEADLLLLGWDRADIAELTPSQLREHASHANDANLLGS